jgi:hypothetical protein
MHPNSMSVFADIQRGRIISAWSPKTSTSTIQEDVCTDWQKAIMEPESVLPSARAREQTCPGMNPHSMHFQREGAVGLRESSKNEK